MTDRSDRWWRWVAEVPLWLLVGLFVGAIMFTLVYFGRQSL